MSRAGRVVVHAIVLGVVNLGGLLAGAAAFFILRGHGQIAMQIPVALIMTVLCFGLWTLLTRGTDSGSLRLDAVRDAFYLYLLAIPFAVVLLVLMGFMTQGHAPSWADLIALVLFQIIANFLTLLVSVAIWTGRLLE